MPQPFKRRPGQVVHMTPATLVKRLKLGVHVANIASHWAKLEQTLAYPFVALLAGQEPAAVASYHELFEINLRHKQYLAVARQKKLPDALIRESEEIHKEVRKAASRRNAVVHGIWAYCDDRPDSILLCEPDALNRKQHEFLESFHDFADQAKAKTPGLKPISFDFTLDDYIEYKHQDFEEITKRIIEIDQTAMNYWEKVTRFSLAAERARRERR